MTITYPPTGFYDLPTFLEAVLPQPEYILSCVSRGEVAQLAAVTNAGKTTLLLNLCLSMANGYPFFDLLTDTQQRRILYADFETPPGKLQRDIKTMLNGMGDEGLENFVLITSDAEIDELPLDLSNERHFAWLEERASKHDADVIVIDTFSAAFNVFDENSNSEITRIMKKLRKLAIELNCCLLFSHHIGKANENQSSEKSYRARGASAFGGMSSTTINLERDLTRGKGYITLSVPKSKGSYVEDAVYRLNPAERWFERCDENPNEAESTLTTADVVQYIFEQSGEVKTADVYARFADVERRTIDRRLKDAVKIGALYRPRKGIYLVKEAANQDSTPRQPYIESNVESSIVQPNGSV